MRETIAKAILKEDYNNAEMARTELKILIQAAQDLLTMLDDMDDNIEPWIASKITKATDYVDSARDYMLNDDEEDDEEDYYDYYADVEDE